jgi:hypothetical protein
MLLDLVGIECEYLIFHEPLALFSLRVFLGP